MKEVLKRLRKNKRKGPPKVEKDGSHVRVGPNERERLKKDFKSSGT